MDLSSYLYICLSRRFSDKNREIFFGSSVAPVQAVAEIGGGCQGVARLEVATGVWGSPWILFW